MIVFFHILGSLVFHFLIIVIDMMLVSLVKLAQMIVFLRNGATMWWSRDVSEVVDVILIVSISIGC